MNWHNLSHIIAIIPFILIKSIIIKVCILGYVILDITNCNLPTLRHLFILVLFITILYKILNNQKVNYVGLILLFLILMIELINYLNKKYYNKIHVMHHLLIWVSLIILIYLDPDF